MSHATSLLGFGPAALDEYLGMWAVLPEHGRALALQTRGVDLRLHVEQAAAAAAAAVGPVAAAGRFGDARGENLFADGTALIRVDGTLMKFSSSLSRGTGTVALRQQVRRAKADAGVQRVLVVVDSPGGAVSGTDALAADLAELAAAKPTHVFVEDVMASAALWIGVQGAVVSASPTALVGSIGTYMAVADYSGMAEKEGIKVHLITTGAFKGAGTPGVAISPAQLAEWQKTVDGINSHFLAAVARGRGLSLTKVKELADGRVHLAADARRLGLIDHVEDLDAAMSRLRGAKGAKSRTAAAAAVDPIAEVNRRVAVHVGRGMSRSAAMREVFIHDEDLRRSWVETSNAAKQTA